jgi:hypothetical protein
VIAHSSSLSALLRLCHVDVESCELSVEPIHMGQTRRSCETNGRQGTPAMLSEFGKSDVNPTTRSSSPWKVTQSSGFRGDILRSAGVCLSSVAVSIANLSSG